MVKKRLFRCLLFLLALCLIVPLSASCSGNKGTEKDTKAGEQGTKKQDESVTTDGEPIAQIDMDGYTYRVNVRSAQTGNKSFPTIDFWVAQEEADANDVSSAVYSRNEYIQARYNCIIEQVWSASDQYSEMINAYYGGTTYEGAILLAKSAATLATNGILIDLAGLKRVNLENSYYDQNAVEQLTMSGALYYVSGDMNVSTLDNAAVTIFNKNMIKNYEIESPYDMVRDGTWTMSNVLEMTKDVTVDTNGDGTLNENDTIGYYVYNSGAIYHYYGAGLRLTEMDEEGYPTLTLNSSASVNLVEWMFENLNPSKNSTVGKGKSSERLKAFNSGNTLFTEMILWDVRTSFRGGEIEYGILPIANNEEGSTDYYNVVMFQDTVHLWSIPQVCESMKYASQMLEIMAAYSTDTTMDAYYNITLSLKSANDPDSMEMLALVRNSLVYDIDLLYDWGGFATYIMAQLLAEDSNSFSTLISSSLESAKKKMEQTIETFANPELPEIE